MKRVLGLIPKLTEPTFEQEVSRIKQAAPNSVQGESATCW
jgi:hypothetical protein